jgi:hypothetical protein
MRLVTRLSAGLSALVATLALGVSTAPGAAAAGGGFTNGGDQGHGYQAIARHVRLTGDTGGNGTPSVNGGAAPFVPCVWRSGMGNAEMAEWAKDNVGDGRIATDGTSYMGTYEGHRSPTVEEFEARRGDTGGAWYIKDCVPPPDLAGVDTGSSYDIQQLYQRFVDPETAAIVWSTTGPPPPPVTPQMLVWFAERALLLLAPQMRHSPADEGVVRLPTWFWSTDRDERVVRAAVGPVWAEAVATPRRISVRASGPASSGVDCPDLGTDGSRAAAGASSCSITFARAGRYGLAAETSYTALWRGSDGGGGPLADKVGPTWTPPAPFVVNEVQVVVDRPGN